MRLKVTKLYRFLMRCSDDCTDSWVTPYRDEYGKITIVKYRLFYFKGYYCWRLDGRTARHIKGVKIVENFLL